MYQTLASLQRSYFVQSNGNEWLDLVLLIVLPRVWNRASQCEHGTEGAELTPG